MPRFALLLAGLAGLALAAAVFGLWRADRVSAGAPVTTGLAVRDAQPVAKVTAVRKEVVAHDTNFDAATADGAAIENGSVDEASVPPSVDEDTELQAAFEALLNDPDPQVRRDAALLAQEFGVMRDE